MKIIKNYTREVYRTKSEWLKARGIGGSSAAVVMGESKWGNKATLFDELQGFKKVIPTSSRMQEGVDSEARIRDLFLIHNKQFKAKKPSKRQYVVYRRVDYPRLTLTPDCLIKNKETKELGFIEVKDVEVFSEKERLAYVEGMIPTQYKWQVLHYYVVKQDLDFGILLVNINIMSKNNETNKWEFSHSETYPISINKEIWKTEINKLFKKELAFLKRVDDNEPFGTVVNLNF